MERVEVTLEMLNIFYMQVCAVADATDEEILRVANEKNPSGTSAGWVRVIREDNAPNEGAKPGPCADFPGRVHYLLEC